VIGREPGFPTESIVVSDVNISGHVPIVLLSLSNEAYGSWNEQT